MFFWTSVSGENGNTKVADNKSDNDNIKTENPENVKSKSVFILFKDKTVSFPLGYSLNSQVLYGARYALTGEKMSAGNLQNIEYFVSPINNGKLVDMYFPESDGFSNFSNASGKFLISVENKGNSDLYMVEFTNGLFGKPIRLDLNSDYNETSGTFCMDGEKIYFTSDRPGGHGGLDIYETEMIGKNKWSNPKNLGEAINTDQDEQCPYMLVDGMTLYFSSKGHESESNFDIYIAVQSDDGTWGEPDRLGEPINSEKDDLFYRMSPDETRAVYYTVGESGEGIYELIFN